MSPKSVAIFGGGWASNVIQQLQKSGYQGEVWPVHPKRDEIRGVKCFATIADLPGIPDAAFIGVNRDATIDVVSRLSNLGCGGAICFASGFREANFDCVHKGDLQDSLVEAAADMPILGPNCYGFLNYLDNVTLWPDQHGGKPCNRGVAIIAQSSNIAINMTMQQRGLAISHMLTLGNQAQTDVSELVAELLADDRVTAIGLYLEGFSDIRSFEQVAIRAREKGKPIVALKIGKSEKAQIATITHTASLAGSAASSTALLQRLGIVEVNSIGVFLETLKLIEHMGVSTGSEVSSVSCSGGEASLMSDLAMGTGLSFRDFSSKQTTALNHVLGEKVTIANPLDYHTYVWGDVPVMTACFEAVMKDDFDLNIFVLDIPRADTCDISGHECAIESIIAAKAATGANVAVVGTLAENLSEAISQRFIAAGVVPMHGMEDSIQAVDAFIRAGELLRKPDSEPLLISPSTRGTTEQYYSLNEFEAKSALTKYGLAIPRSCIAHDKANIANAAQELSFPLALKGLGIAHKTEAGGVILGIDSRSALDQAAQSLPDCADGYLIEEMSEKPVAELIVGVTKDDLGLFLLTLGAGGILTELLSDSISLLLPCSRREITEAIKSLKVFTLLDGYRGQASANIDSVVDAIEAVSHYVRDNHEKIKELDINPLMAGTDTAVAVDALISLRK